MNVRLDVTAEDRRIAHLAALAVGLSVAEAAIPSPLPGVKPGVANIITLLVLERYGWRTAAWVSLLRVVATSILLGGFLSPTFALSLSGATLSLLVLGLGQALPRTLFGPVTLSILAAIAHMGGQIAVAYAWFIPHAGIAYLLPLFGAAALVFGTVNGIIAASLLARPETAPTTEPTA